MINLTRYPENKFVKENYEKSWSCDRHAMGGDGKSFPYGCYKCNFDLYIAHGFEKYMDGQSWCIKPKKREDNL